MALSLATLATASAAHAVPSSGPSDEVGLQPRMTFDASTGLGAPGGLVSVGGALHISEYAVRGGVGYAWDGPQFYAGLTGHPLALARNPTARLGLGAFWSTGTYATGFTSPKHYWRHAHWVSLEASLLIRHAPLEGRVFAGGAILANAGDGVCANFVNCAAQLPAQRAPLVWVPYVGFSGSFALF